MQSEIRKKLAEENINILNLIYNMGKGVLHLSHIQKYMLHFELISHNETMHTVQKLTNWDILDSLPGQMIKIKKIGIAVLRGHLRSCNVKSIKITDRLLKLSYMKNQMILQSKTKGETINEMIKYYLCYTTLISNELNACEIFKQSNTKNAYDSYMLMKDYKSSLFKSTDGTYKNNGLTIRNLMKRNMFLSTTKQDAINVIFFPLSSMLDHIKIVDWFIEAYEFLRECFPTRNILFHIVFDIRDSIIDIESIRFKLTKRIAQKEYFKYIHIRLTSC